MGVLNFFFFDIMPVLKNLLCFEYFDIFLIFFLLNCFCRMSHLWNSVFGLSFVGFETCSK